ncbi:hypothetical protein SA496_24250 [Pseudomonas sp. JS3066]|nr:hypothetical protein [Pseudomonas sp. JS3066]WVK92790.1 hypothetical protein SA496_24250 [Pseudomonas sp. JS3066]
MTQAYNDAGWQGSVTAGVEGARFAVELVGVLTAVRGTAQVAAKLPDAAKQVVNAIAEAPASGGWKAQVGAVGDLGKLEVPGVPKATSGPVELKFDKTTRSWTTPAGLDYGQGSIHGNRVKHVLDHAAPNPNKTTHSVFNVDRKEVLGLIDQAWLKKGGSVSGDPGAYIVPMGRAIGTAGETSIKIILRPGTNKIITAYPVK